MPFLSFLFFFFNIAVQFHSLRLQVPFMQAASLQKADKELESRETLKRLSLVADTLSWKQQNQEANKERTGLKDSRAAAGTDRWSCHCWTAPTNQLHASHFLGGKLFKAFPKISFLPVNKELIHFSGGFSCHDESRISAACRCGDTVGQRCGKPGQHHRPKHGISLF